MQVLAYPCVDGRQVSVAECSAARTQLSGGTPSTEITACGALPIACVSLCHCVDSLTCIITPQKETRYCSPSAFAVQQGLSVCCVL